jgi:PilZ domain-containing protein
MQRRQHSRVRLRLPARLRWSAPLGQRTEQCETINASRGGLLLYCSEEHAAGHPLWVAFPFDAEALGMQPETLARVTRSVKTATGDAPKQWKVALQFEQTARLPFAGNGKRGAAEKRNGAGKNFALPIRVRPLHIPWHEEAMTTEISPDKLRFVTNREYTFGERLLVSFVSRSEAPWHGDEEWEAEVTGIEMEAGKDSVLVTVRKRS